MAYGSPGSMEEVKDYYTNIRNGVPPDTDHLKTLENKYKAIGGVSPLLRTTMQQAHLLEEKLNSTPGSNFKVYVGMRHWRPFIHDAVKKAVESRANKFIALSLAPHYSEMTIGAYNKAAEDALKASGQEANAVYSKGWGSNHAFIEALAEKTSQPLGKQHACFFKLCGIRIAVLQYFLRKAMRSKQYFRIFHFVPY